MKASQRLKQIRFSAKEDNLRVARKILADDAEMDRRIAKLWISIGYCISGSMLLLFGLVAVNYLP